MSESPWKLEYDRKRFDPPRAFRPAPAKDIEVGDQRERPPYVFTEDIVLAVNVALVTGRPILVRGKSGCGKSSLARAVAEVNGWRFYETVITSRTQHKDLLYDVDLLARLHDAQSAARAGDGQFDPRLHKYVSPGVLWWAFDRADALRHIEKHQVRTTEPRHEENEKLEKKPAVVLIDEIDKADPDVPNNLLVPLGSLRFEVEEIGHLVRVTKPKDPRAENDPSPLVLITTNEERRLPDPFLRRCIELELEYPRWSRLVEIGEAHLGKKEKRWIESVLTALVGPKPEAEDEAPGPELSPAELVDVLKAFRGLDLSKDAASPAARAVQGITIWKHDRNRKAP